ncbi:hypothetical protein DL1_08545 [Thioclava dalianensis]|uniref:Terminase small subunit n=2 Tax=Thioclava dalianensis TaxID=1185766 RepID=A0A074TF79_9RHOB|nr:hypothetical protein DL1_08545 [Thioclava dalianensis]SFN49842.1 Terminase small subunit [Thioclava dalianensis]
MAPQKKKKTTPARAKTTRKKLDADAHKRRMAFAAQYVIDLNAAQAAIRAGYSEKGARQTGARLLTYADVQEEIARLMAERAARLEIEQDDVLRRWWTQATLDVNELVQNRHGACRYCHGADHDYQWKTRREFNEAYDKAALPFLKGMTPDQPEHALIQSREYIHPKLPNDLGGYGYRLKVAPNPDCPECGGDGISYVHVVDTRTISPEARMVYEGMKETKQGIEVKISDRGKALEMVARHLGMLNGKVELDASAELLEAARALNLATTTIAPGALSLDDDE